MNYKIQHGDTLSALAKRYGTSVAALAQANGIKDPNKIYAGARLIIPDKFQSKADQSNADRNDGYAKRKPSLEEYTGSHPKLDPSNAGNDDEETTTTGSKEDPRRQETDDENSTVSQVTNPAKQPSTGGSYPLYAQGDPRWGQDPMGTDGGKKDHIAAIGCAMTTVTMALDGITGQKMTPKEMNEFLRKNGGYDRGGSVNWEVMGKAARPPVGVKRQPEGSYGPKQIDAELAAGRPVAIHVDYHGKNGAKGPDGKGDHWILITGKTADGHYTANDPAGGKQITMHEENGKLVADSGKPYVSTGGAVTFSRGPAGGTTNGTTTTPPVNETGPVKTTVSGTDNGYKSIDPADFRKGGTQSLAAIVVGNAEGNRTPNGSIVHKGHFDGHGDPANGARNIGSFSAQGKYVTQSGNDPYKADQLVLNDMAAATPAFEKAAKDAGLDPHNALLLSTYYDMKVQSPATAAAFLKELPGLAKTGVTPENLVKAKIHAFYNNGKSGGWHDPKYANKVHADAERRMRAIVTALKAQGLAN
jgi:LysM repeat protein